MQNQNSIKYRLSNYFRQKRDIRLREFLISAKRKTDTLRIVDFGGSSLYWQRVGIDFLKEHKISIELVNIEESELKSEQDNSDIFTYRVGNACNLDSPDNSFDICHSNSVVEHVGSWNDMLAFGREVRRIAPSYYVQTPNYWFPIDPHFASVPFFHWMPRPIRARLLEWFPIATAGKAKDCATSFSFVDSSRLLTKRQMRTLFPQSNIISERLLLLPKSVIAIKSSK